MTETTGQLRKAAYEAFRGFEFSRAADLYQQAMDVYPIEGLGSRGETRALDIAILQGKINSAKDCARKLAE